MDMVRTDDHGDDDGGDDDGDDDDERAEAGV